MSASARPPDRSATQLSQQPDPTCSDTNRSENPTSPSTESGALGTWGRQCGRTCNVFRRRWPTSSSTGRSARTPGSKDREGASRRQRVRAAVASCASQGRVSRRQAETAAPVVRRISRIRLIPSGSRRTRPGRQCTVHARQSALVVASPLPLDRSSQPFNRYRRPLIEISSPVSATWARSSPQQGDPMARRRRYPFSRGPSRIQVNKGSRSRMRRITLRGNWSVELWVAAVTLILAFALLLPLAVEHAARHYLR